MENQIASLSPFVLTLATFIGLGGLIGTTIFHYRALSLISRYYVTRKFTMGSFEAVMCAALAIHTVEIIFFGLIMAFSEQIGLGSLSGSKESYFLDYIYYAAVTYTSVGYGDLTPVGAMRALGSITALTGLMLVSLSGAFIATLVQRGDNHAVAQNVARASHHHDLASLRAELSHLINEAKHQAHGRAGEKPHDGLLSELEKEWEAKHKAKDADENKGE